MSLTLWIPAAWQYGELPPAVGRHGALRQAVVQAIKRHLFAETAEESPLGASFGEVLLAFWAGLAEPLSPRARDSVRALWAALFPPDALRPPATADKAPTPLASSVNPDAGQSASPPPTNGQDGTRPDEIEIPPPVSDGFCWSVQGLCTALALGWLGERPDALGIHDAEDEEAEADAETGSAPGRPDAPPLATRVEYFAAVSAIAHWVRLAAWRQRQASEAAGAGDEDIRLVAAILLDTLLRACGEAFAVVTGETVRLEGKAHTLKWVELRNPALVKGITALLAELPARFTVQPLRQPVAYRPGKPEPASDAQGDQFRVELIGYRRQNNFLRRLQAGLQAAEYRAPGFAAYLEAINGQQAVAWRVNGPLLGVVDQLRALAADPEANPEVWGVRSDAVSSGPAVANRAAVRAWVLERIYTPPPAGERKTIQRPAEFLDSPLARQALAQLCPADAPPPPFYLAWKADYRGRIYAGTPWLTPQGGDLQRALLEFAQGRALDEAGVGALRRHGANLVRRERLLADLGIADRQVLTLEERERWVREHETEILASAVSPLTAPFWRQVAGKPMQFLAFCLAYCQWRLDPAAPVHLPVQIDGTCNGLQHIAALTGDAGLARAVNVLPRADGLPGDIYSELATAAAEGLGQLEERRDPLHGPGLALADRWLAAAPARREWLCRDTAKKVVMTIPYGAGDEAQARYVLAAIATDFEREWEAAPTEARAAWLTDLDGCVTWTGGAADSPQDQARRGFVIGCTRLPHLFPERRRQAFAAEDEQERAQARAHWERMRALAAYCALAIVRHLRAALSARYPLVDGFSRWLRRVAKACEGVPLVWLSPRGFPVCQDKFMLRGSSLNARLGSREVRVDIKRLTEEVARRDQGNALLPNLIHSLDATHLAMTLLSAARRGVTDVGTIHDCLLCHPNEAPVLGKVVRQTFVELYGLDAVNAPGTVSKPLARWRDWMSLVAELRDCEDHALLLGALHEPGGMGESMLRADAAAQQRRAAVLGLLEKLRALDPSHLFLARQLLEYRGEHEVGDPKGKPLSDPPVGQGLVLPIGATLSEYFFS
ncbi:MAG: DNA-directed RNA polymerase [Chromatiaceae bacterium]